MKKYIVETYYTCTFKTIHNLNDLNDQELNKVDQRTDGKVEVIDVKLNNRKTRKIGIDKDFRTLQTVLLPEPIPPVNPILSGIFDDDNISNYWVF